MNILKKLFTSSNQSNNITSPHVKEPITAVSSNVKNYRITGVKYYEDNLMKLAANNPSFSMDKKEMIASKLFDTYIYKHTFSPNKIELIPEPENIHDSNAIKVVIDAQHIGYIKAGSCKHILKLINENRIEKITCRISGGYYKMLVCHDDECNDCEIDKGRQDYSIQITITEK